jgi:hypothetical protein
MFRASALHYHSLDDEEQDEDMLDGLKAPASPSPRGTGGDDMDVTDGEPDLTDGGMAVTDPDQDAQDVEDAMLQVDDDASVTGDNAAVPAKPRREASNSRGIPRAPGEYNLLDTRFLERAAPDGQRPKGLNIADIEDLEEGSGKQIQFQLYVDWMSQTNNRNVLYHPPMKGSKRRRVTKEGTAYIQTTLDVLERTLFTASAATGLAAEKMLEMLGHFARSSKTGEWELFKRLVQDTSGGVAG